MTKKELEKEAEEKAKKRTKGFKCQDNCEKSYVMGALDFAEPREKQIEILSKHILELQADKGRLTDRVRELEAQIEKMKCCGNCKSYNMTYLPYYCNKKNEPKHCTSKCDKWEIKEE